MALYTGPCSECCDPCAFPTTMIVTFSGIVTCDACTSLGGGLSQKYSGSANGAVILTLVSGTWVGTTSTGPIRFQIFSSPDCSGPAFLDENLDLECTVGCSGGVFTVNFQLVGNPGLFFNGSGPKTSPIMNAETVCNYINNIPLGFNGTATISS